MRKLSIPGIIRQGLLQTTIQYTCFHISLAYISSSESAIINASNVFISVIAAHFLLKNERLSWETIFGCIAGLAGVILINLTGILMVVFPLGVRDLCWRLLHLMESVMYI